MLDLDAARDPVVPKDASTVVVLRDHDGELQVFCVKRHGKSGFLGGAVVFPGGKVAPEDHALDWAARSNGLSAGVASFSDSPLTFAVAALRELFEEASLLAATEPVDDANAKALRAQLSQTEAANESQAFFELLTTAGLCLDTARLHALSRWITPKAEKRRYDTRFYLLPFEEAQAGVHDSHETTNSFWAPPRDVLRMWEQEEIFLAPPTSETLTTLTRAGSVAEALALSESGSLAPCCPHFCLEGPDMVLALPGDPLYPQDAPAPASPEAPTRFVLQGMRFVPRRVLA